MVGNVIVYLNYMVIILYVGFYEKYMWEYGIDNRDIMLFVIL